MNYAVVDEFPKQPTSIEEAAKKYALTLVDEHEGTPQYICFIAGAKSDSAKQYWFEIFKQENKRKKNNKQH